MGSTSVKPHLPSYVVVGDDPHLTDVAVDKLLAGLNESSVNQFGPAEDIESVLQAIATPSMFDDRRTIVVREVDKFPAEAQRKLIACLENPVPDATLILVGAKLPSQMVSAARRSGHVIEVEKGKRQDLFAWLKQQASAKGLSLSGEAMNALIEAVGEQRLALSQAVEELSLAKPAGTRLTVNDVTGQFQGRADVKLFAFIDAVAQRQASVALENLHYLVSQGESPSMLFWTLARHFRQLLVAAESSPKQVAKTLGLPEWRAEKLVRQARGFGQEGLVEAYRLLALADVKIKNSEEPERLTLERWVVAVSRRR
ncbi:MAG TPA: DNA polymerase III subunit delta [Actinomycetota bacterium]|nr:DNA polymerase III subunit delta [Actinomycetota bacterium]